MHNFISSINSLNFLYSKNEVQVTPKKSVANNAMLALLEYNLQRGNLKLLNKLRPFEFKFYPTLVHQQEKVKLNFPILKDNKLISSFSPSIFIERGSLLESQYDRVLTLNALSMKNTNIHGFKRKVMHQVKFTLCEEITEDSKYSDIICAFVDKMELTRPSPEVESLIDMILSSFCNSEIFTISTQNDKKGFTNEKEVLENLAQYLT